MAGGTTLKSDKEDGEGSTAGGRAKVSVQAFCPSCGGGSSEPPLPFQGLPFTPLPRFFSHFLSLFQWASVPYSLRDEDSVKRVLEGSDIAINCIGAKGGREGGREGGVARVSGLDALPSGPRQGWDRRIICPRARKPSHPPEPSNNNNTHGTSLPLSRPPSLPVFPLLSSPGKYYDTKHLVPHRDASGKLSNVNFSLEEVHIEAPAKVRLPLSRFFTAPAPW
jgi:hypothetical protein